MDESWLDEIRPDKTEIKFTLGFGFIFAEVPFIFEFLISMVGQPLIFKIFSIKVTCYSH